MATLKSRILNYTGFSSYLNPDAPATNDIIQNSFEIAFPEVIDLLDNDYLQEFAKEEEITSEVTGSYLTNSIPIWVDASSGITPLFKKEKKILSCQYGIKISKVLSGATTPIISYNFIRDFDIIEGQVTDYTKFTNVNSSLSPMAGGKGIGYYQNKNLVFVNRSSIPNSVVTNSSMAVIDPGATTTTSNIIKYNYIDYFDAVNDIELGTHNAVFIVLYYIDYPANNNVTPPTPAHTDPVCQYFDKYIEEAVLVKTAIQSLSTLQHYVEGYFNIENFAKNKAMIDEAYTLLLNHDVEIARSYLEAVTVNNNNIQSTFTNIKEMLSTSIVAKINSLQSLFTNLIASKSSKVSLALSQPQTPPPTE